MFIKSSFASVALLGYMASAVNLEDSQDTVKVSINFGATGSSGEIANLDLVVDTTVDNPCPEPAEPELITGVTVGELPTFPVVDGFTSTLPLPMSFDFAEDDQPDCRENFAGLHSSYLSSYASYYTSEQDEFEATDLMFQIMQSTGFMMVDNDDFICWATTTRRPDEALVPLPFETNEDCEVPLRSFDFLSTFSSAIGAEKKVNKDLLN